MTGYSSIATSFRSLRTFPLKAPQSDALLEMLLEPEEEEALTLSSSSSFSSMPRLKLGWPLQRSAAYSSSSKGAPGGTNWRSEEGNPLISSKVVALVGGEEAAAGDLEGALPHWGELGLFKV